nr:immunoglobulin-binding protein 1-like [Saimiri boliviensis boliviensis]
MAAEDKLLLPWLPELFETSKRLLDKVEGRTESTGSWIVQKVFKGLDLLEKAAKMLKQLDLFSRNEHMEETASTDLKYVLVPAFQGAFTMKQVNPRKHLDHLQWAQEHFINYLTQCHCHHVAESELPTTKDNSAENHTADSSRAYPSLIATASQRQAKTERYKQKKELGHRLPTMKSAVETGQADDERVHDYYLLHLQRWIVISIEAKRIKNLKRTLSLFPPPFPSAGTSRPSGAHLQGLRARGHLSFSQQLTLVLPAFVRKTRGRPKRQAHPAAP